MNIHLIAIGGAAMHNIALDLQRNHKVTGSDDEIYNPSKARLEEAGLLPQKMGWHPEMITKDLDIVILGMHAKKNNPELLRAQEIGLTVMSYPEFIFHHSKDKKRVVIAGSHGKTTTTSMILHVLKIMNHEFDYLVGAQIKGFERMVQLSDAPIIILEGDEYLSSPLDLRPKMLHYQPDIAVITGIAWDHINVFPSFEFYKSQFAEFAQTIQKEGTLIYYKHDEHIKDILENKSFDYKLRPYGKCETSGRTLKVFGRHNMENLEAARLVCHELGIKEADFWNSIESFDGAGKRLELLHESDSNAIYLDFAHAPSKLKATTEAVKSKYPNRTLNAFFELHTFSSLNKAFLPHYSKCLAEADRAFVYFDPHTLKMKGMPDIKKAFVEECFNHDHLTIISSSEDFLKELHQLDQNDAVILLMSSGKFGGVNIKNEIGKLIGNS